MKYGNTFRGLTTSCGVQMFQPAVGEFGNSCGISRLAMTSPDLPHTDLELRCFQIPVSQTMENIRQFSGDPPFSKVLSSYKQLVRKDITCVIVGVELKLIPKPSKEKNCQYFNMESSAAINVL